MFYYNEELMERARCKDAPNPDIFFPNRDKDTYKEVAAQAKQYCFGVGGKNPCPIRVECLWQAIETDEQHGIWGGLSHRERNALVRKWQKRFKQEMTLKEFIHQLDKKEN